jgi:membrane-bound ClpP family serine protease
VTALAWIAALVAVGMALLVLEVFVPSGGVLGFLSVVAIVAGVVTAFVEKGPAFGLGALAVAVAAVPAVLTVAFRIFPHTPLGRRVIPPPPGPGDVVPDADRRAALRGLVGRAGRATVELLPWGTVEVDGIVHEAVSDGGPIASGRGVEVVGVQATALVVRRADEPSTRPLTPPDEPVRPGETDLEEALEAFDFESLGRMAGGNPGPTGGKLDSGPRPNKS